MVTKDNIVNTVNYALYVKVLDLTEDDVIGHIVKTFHPEASVKQALILKHNLTLILNATFKLSRVMSFSKMTVRDLQKETGISMGGLYNSFASKEELEKMVIVGVEYVTDYTEKKGAELELSDEQYLYLAIKVYVFLGRYFKSWYFFVAMEFRTMSEDNFRQVVALRARFLGALSILMKGNDIAAAHLGSIIQDFNIRDWQYKHVDIDDFANHCVTLARIFNENAEYMGELPINLSGE